MKTDKLEKFVVDNRDEFDNLTPNPAIWDKIQKREPETVSLNWTNILVVLGLVIRSTGLRAWSGSSRSRSGNRVINE